MSALELLLGLEAAGACALIDQGDLVIRARRGVLTDENRQAIRQKKAGLLFLLHAREQGLALAPLPEGPFAEVLRCWCAGLDSVATATTW